MAGLKLSTSTKDTNCCCCCSEQIKFGESMLASAKAKGIICKDCLTRLLGSSCSDIAAVSKAINSIKMLSKEDRQAALDILEATKVIKRESKNYELPFYINLGEKLNGK